MKIEKSTGNALLLKRQNLGSNQSTIVTFSGPYKIGDLVYVLTPKGSRGKLGEVWCGPWKVVSRTGVIYTLEWVQPGKKKRNRRYHFNLLKFCLPRSENRWNLPNCEVLKRQTEMTCCLHAVSANHPIALGTGNFHDIVCIFFLPSLCDMKVTRLGLSFRMCDLVIVQVYVGYVLSCLLSIRFDL